MFFAMFLMKHEEDLNTAKTIFTAIGLLIPPLVMIYRQPDLKNTITVMVLFCFMMYVAGLSYKVIAVVLVSGSALVLALLLVITQVNFHFRRLLTRRLVISLGEFRTGLSDDARQRRRPSPAAEFHYSHRFRKADRKRTQTTIKFSSANKGNFRFPEP